MKKTTKKTLESNVRKRTSRAENRALNKATSKAKFIKAPGDTPMAIGRGWRLSRDGGRTEFTASLQFVHDLGDRYIALFKMSG